MIDSLIRVLDRLVQLKDYRDRRLSMLLADFIQPTYEDLLNVHRDYLKLFERARQMLPSRDFLASPCVAWRGKFDYAIFESDQDAELFAEEVGQDSVARLLLRKAYEVHWTPPKQPDRVRVFFKSREDAMAFASERHLNKPVAAQMTPLPDGTLEKVRATERFVREARLEFAPIRSKLKSTSMAWRELELPGGALEFLEAVARYFPEGSFDITAAGRYSSGATQVLLELQRIKGQSDSETDGYGINEPLSSADYLLSSLEHHYQRHWEEVTDSYSRFAARVAAL